MNLQSPVAAMLWENWRLTRIEAGQRLALGLVGGAGALLMFGAGHAFWILVMIHAFFYMSIAKLNGGKFMDGYKPGFPLYLFYTRPVSTSAYVGVAMAYDAITGAAMYLASAALLSYLFDQPLPLFSMALLILVYHLAYLCIQWSTQSRVVQWIGSIVITLPAFFLLQGHLASPAEFELSFVQGAMLIVLGVVSFFITVAGVARQRRGEAVAILRPEGSAGYPEWLVNLFRLDCPTSSPTRAQVWFELKSSGLPALTVGLGLAIVIFLLFAIAIPFGYFRPIAMISVMLSGPILLLLLGGNALGIRKRQGRTYASAFEVTQPFNIGRQVAVKLLVRTGCVLAALALVLTSVWLSTSLLGSWGSWILEGGKDAVPEFLKIRREIAGSVASIPGYALAAQAVIACVAVGVMIALFATFAAVKARYPRRLLIAGSLLLLHGFLLVLLVLAVQSGKIPATLVSTVFETTALAFLAAIVLVTIYLSWTGFRERALTPAYAGGVIAISAVVAAAWFALAHASGASIAAMSAGDAAMFFWPLLLPPMVGVLAPWAFSRIRHI